MLVLFFSQEFQCYFKLKLLYDFIYNYQISILFCQQYLIVLYIFKFSKIRKMKLKITSSYNFSLKFKILCFF